MNDTDLIKNIGFDYGITAGLFESHEGREINRLKASLKDIQEELEKARKTAELPERYIINENATILFWKDGEKTIVKKCEDDEFNPRLAFLTAFFQHYCDMSKNKANRFLASLKIEGIPKNNKETFIKVIDVGSTYPNYVDFLETHFPTYLKDFSHGGLPKKNKKYRLIGQANHLSCGTKLALIQDIDSSQVFIIRYTSIKEAK